MRTPKKKYKNFCLRNFFLCSPPPKETVCLRHFVPIRRRLSGNPTCFIPPMRRPGNPSRRQLVWARLPAFSAKATTRRFRPFTMSMTRQTAGCTPSMNKQILAEEEEKILLVNGDIPIFAVSSKNGKQMKRRPSGALVMVLQENAVPFRMFPGAYPKYSNE